MLMVCHQTSRRAGDGEDADTLRHIASENTPVVKWRLAVGGVSHFQVKQTELKWIELNSSELEWPELNWKEGFSPTGHTALWGFQKKVVPTLKYFEYRWNKTTTLLSLQDPTGSYVLSKQKHNTVLHWGSAIIDMSVFKACVRISAIVFNSRVYMETLRWYVYVNDKK